MKALYLFTAAFISLTCISCTSIEQPIDHLTNKSVPRVNTSMISSECPPKNPLKISFYPKGKQPALPYVVIGKEYISKYNVHGIKRQDATLHEVMRQMAAEMGGDAIINLQHNAKGISGTIVAYKQDISSTDS